MSFISFHYLVLFGAALALCMLLRHRGQNTALLVASYVFYAWWDWRFLGLILLSSVVDFFCALWLDRKRHPGLSPARRRSILALSLSVNLGALGLFKYFDFLSRSANDFAAVLGFELGLPLLDVILPVGISFYTFQTISYTVDVFRGRVAATDRFFDFLLYVSFFPQLVAGPIERASHFLPQILTPRPWSTERLYSGAQLALVGFFKKMVVADNMALLVNEVYGHPQPGGPAVWLATYAFALQIYCDFSGYTDIARGCARMLGFELLENFRLPYLAVSPSDFWRRWHSSLSSWLKDYLYIPLGGNRHGRLRTLVNLMLTMLLGGLWHGASWTFVLWGAFHGLLLVAFRTFSRKGRRRGRRDASPGPADGRWFLLRAFLYFHLTCFGWLLFRATSFRHVLSLLGGLGDLSTWGSVPVVLALQVFAVFLPLMAFQYVQHRSDEMEPWRRWPLWLRIPFYLGLFYGIVLLSAPKTNEFIYFQF